MICQVGSIVRTHSSLFYQLVSKYSTRQGSNPEPDTDDSHNRREIEYGDLARNLARRTQRSWWFKNNSCDVKWVGKSIAYFNTLIMGGASLFITSFSLGSFNNWRTAHGMDCTCDNILLVSWRGLETLLSSL
jgi:hypothetical protein